MIPDSSVLALINATLNASAALCLAAGYAAIRRKRITLHRVLMGTAFLFSSIFLVSYLTRYGIYGDTPFQKQGLIRVVYFSILISHIVCAIATLPLVLRTLYLAIRRDFIAHKKLARITFPLWTYVSITGVIVYVMLYQIK